MGVARTIGILAGLFVLLSLLVLGKPQSREPTLGVDLEITVAEAGGIELSRQFPLPVLRDPDLVKGRVVGGTLSAENISARPLRVGFTMTSAGESIGTVAAGQVWIRISQGGAELARSSAPTLSQGTGSVVIEPGDRKKFELEAWIAGDRPGLYAGQKIFGRMAMVAVPVAGGRG